MFFLVLVFVAGTVSRRVVVSTHGWLPGITTVAHRALLSRRIELSSVVRAHFGARPACWSQLRAARELISTM